MSTPPDPATLHRLVMEMLLDPVCVAGDADSTIGDRLNPLRQLLGLATIGTYGLPEHVNPLGPYGLPELPPKEATGEVTITEDDRISHVLQKVAAALRERPGFDFDDMLLRFTETDGGEEVFQLHGELSAARTALSAVSYAHHHRDAADVLGDTTTEQLIEMARAAVGVFEGDQGELEAWRDGVRAALASELEDDSATASLDVVVDAIGVLIRFGEGQYSERQRLDTSLELWRRWAAEVLPGIVTPAMEDELLRVRIEALVKASARARVDQGDLDLWRTWATEVLPGPAEHDDTDQKLRNEVSKLVQGYRDRSDALEAVELERWRELGRSGTSTRTTTGRASTPCGYGWPTSSSG